MFLISRDSSAPSANKEPFSARKPTSVSKFPNILILTQDTGSAMNSKGRSRIKSKKFQKSLVQFSALRISLSLMGKTVSAVKKISFLILIVLNV